MESLIDEVKKHPALYDHRDDNFHDKQHKNNIWAQIATKLNYSNADEALHYWKTQLRDFQQEIQKQERVRKIRTQSSKYEWRYMAEMNFFLPFIKRNQEYLRSKNIGIQKKEKDVDPSRLCKKLKRTLESLRDSIQISDKRFKLDSVKEFPPVKDLQEDNPLYHFFMTVYNSTHTMPENLQLRMKKKVFDIMSNAENMLRQSTENGTST